MGENKIPGSSRNARIMALAVVGIMIASGLLAFGQIPAAKELPQSDNPVLPAESLTTAYPNAGWLSLWQGPNQSDPNYVGINNAFPVTSGSLPGPAGLYWGSNTYVVFDPDSNYTAMFGGNPNPHYAYTWVDVNNRNLFPDSCHLLICAVNVTDATKISLQAATDPRISAVWFGDFIPGSYSVAWMGAMYNATKSHAPWLEFYLDIYSYVWDATTHYDYWSGMNSIPGTPWPSAYLPYFDGIFYGPWIRTPQKLLDHSVSLYDCMMDLHRLTPGKELIMQLFNWHYSYGAFPWEYMTSTLATTAQLYRMGIISGVSMLATFFDDINPITSNYMRNFLNSELVPQYSTTLNLASKIAATTLDGIATDSAVTSVTSLKANNWSFYSFHTQTVTFTGLTGTHVTVRDLTTGKLYEIGTGTFVAEAGAHYQVYNWPHTTVWYSGNLAITTPQVTTDERLVVNGTIYLNSSWTITRSLIQIGIDHYIDLLDNQSVTLPAWGIILKPSGYANYTIRILDSTIEPLHRLFPYTFSLNTYNPGTRTFTMLNSTIACWVDTLHPSGQIVTVNNSIFYNGYDISGVTETRAYEIGTGTASYWTNNLFYSTNAGGTIGVWIDFGSYIGYGPSYQTFENNTIVGGAIGMDAGLEYNPGTVIAQNNVIYRADYNTTADDHGAYAYAGGLYPGLNRDFAKTWTYTPFTSYQSDSSGRTIAVTTMFRIDAPSAFNGTLKDATGATIGTYNSVGNAIQAYRIPLFQDVNGVITNQHPYPWTFHVTAIVIPAGDFCTVQSYGTLGSNRTLRFAPFFLPFENNTVTFTAEDSIYMHIKLVPKFIYAGIHQYISNGTDLHMGTYVEGWNPTQYTIPSQVAVSVTTTNGTLQVWGVSYAPTATDKVVQFSASSSDSSARTTFTVSGLDSGTGYRVTVDGVVIYQQLKGQSSLTFTYSGPWSTHTFIVTAYESSSTSIQASFSFTLDGANLRCTDLSYGPVVTRVWNFGDGSGSGSMSPSHRYWKAGTFTISLTVYDAAGHSSVAQKTITISPNSIPISTGPGTLHVGFGVNGFTVTGAALIFFGVMFLILGYAGVSVPFIGDQGRRLLGWLLLLGGLFLEFGQSLIW